MTSRVSPSRTPCDFREWLKTSFAKDRTAAVVRGAGTLFDNKRGERGVRDLALDGTRLRIEASNCRQFLIAAEFRLCHRRFQDSDRSVIHLHWYRKGMAVLAAMGKGETSRIAEAARRAVDEFRNEGQGAKGPFAHTGCQQERRIIGGTAIGGRSKIRLQAAENDISCADVVP